jgi:N6-L-threonylcarbamoyladenine synthase
MILGLESSCDESALSLLEKDGTIVGEWVHSQVARHAEYGGVVPDLAVGEHLRNFFPLLALADPQGSLRTRVSMISVPLGKARTRSQPSSRSCLFSFYESRDSQG